MRMPPSPVRASTSAPKPSGSSSVTEPSPVTMSQSPPGELPLSARIVTLPSPVWTRSPVSLPSSLIEPSPVFASTSPPSRRPRMLPSPERSCTRPVTLSMSIEPSPLFAAMSEDAGTETISLAERVWKCRLKPRSCFGSTTRISMRLPLCSAFTSIADTSS